MIRLSLEILKYRHTKNTTMENPTEINSVYWDEKTKSWQYKVVLVEEYHGFTECQHCRRPMSHNIKSEGEFKVVYVKCGCSRE